MNGTQCSSLLSVRTNLALLKCLYLCRFNVTCLHIPGTCVQTIMPTRDTPLKKHKERPDPTAQIGDAFNIAARDKTTSVPASPKLMTPNFTVINVYLISKTPPLFQHMIRYSKPWLTGQLTFLRSFLFSPLFDFGADHLISCYLKQFNRYSSIVGSVKFVHCHVSY